ncbi:kin of IRRE-like protein 1 isoform X3 [Tribolium castaneum]|uniref:kin of IRRE-like protein 1 isoform X3 n=1 Tax=Tribolium castaneum TaxID=7070 RepID=UPI00077DC5F6|nr:PREDICTED: kin of IRRE-like protein 1 isoform X5 [Tribolium castaneum]|eukprot:XP_015833725.1 PREDICTED: kin of IRRE-like protein 1 isoform X5 [Tribolium castaneum]
MLKDSPWSILVNGGMQSSGGNGFNALPESGTLPPMGPPAVPQNRFEPYFDAMTPRNVTALVGKSAYLSCRVRNLGNKTVSWIRHRDIHILTVGSYTYTSDQRFQANHHPETDEWTLQIKWAQKRDAGIYECQISTQPVRSYFVNLNVVVSEVPAGDEPSREVANKKNCSSCSPVPTAQILGGPDLHVDKGSTINLTCSIRFSPEPPAYIFWYHRDDVISYDSNRGGVSVITEKGDVTTSFLLIQHADISDSGKYSCSPSNADVASVRVHVLNGERPAAMQTGSAGLSNSSLNILALMIISYIYTAIYLSLQLETKQTVAALR